MRVLLVEDEPKMAALLQRGLRDAGIAADVAGTGEDALWMTASSSYEVIVLDVLLPGADGFAVCRTLRGREDWTPVLMLTALDAVDERVRGLDAGADDYLVKPVSSAELRARLRALSRRVPRARPVVHACGPVRVDPATRRAWCHDAELELSHREFGLLETFVKADGQALSRFELLESVWDRAYENRSNIIDVYVGHLRRKLAAAGEPDVLQTVRGVGYRLAGVG